MVFHIASCNINPSKFRVSLLLIGVISSLGLGNSALAAVANFDSLTPGFAGSSVTEDDITFSNLIAGRRLETPQFLVQSDNQFEPLFSNPNYLTFGIPDVETTPIGFFGSMMITPGQVSHSVSLDVLTLNPSFGSRDSVFPPSNDSLVLEAFFQGESVARTSVLITDFSDFGRGGRYLSSTLSLSGVRFDDLQLYIPRAFADGVIPLAVDDVTISAVPEPLTILGTATAIAFGTQFKRKLNRSNKKKNS
ncbi:PEP-CTERM sorting domain-containing protein [Crocosphaera sp.]|uniref:PEP-CTERM sorting domain-containing protein n=1 Tax=Crocosphaera sp. TaxID=2729996 RepID=UPI003F21D8FD|nr:PEP-CTERM sorting domain-containing protein [Crocosphaera sp.]